MFRQIKYLVFLILLGGTGSAWAACTLTDGSNNVLPGPVKVYVSNSNLNWDGVFNPGDVVLGGKILALRAVQTSGDVYVTCTETKSLYGVPVGTPVGALPGGTGAYNTGIYGVGAAFCNYKGGGCTGWLPSGQYYNLSAGVRTKISGISPAYQLAIELRRFADITAQAVFSGPFAEWRHGSATGQPLLEFHWQNLTVSPIVPTCEVSTPAIAVGMGSVYIGAFTGVGSLSSAKDFKIRLACSGGATNTYTNVHVTLTDVTNPGNTSTVLSLSPESTATGVGIQILNNGVVRGYGPDSSAPGNLNQWKAGAVSVGTSAFEIPLSARYIQTSETVTEGTANARATFTMSYQ